jgi:hypothetical protein
MRVLNEAKTQELFYYDQEAGYLRPDKLVLVHHAATEKFDGVGHYESKTYPNGGVERWWVWDIAPTEAKEAWDETEDILVYVPYTAEDLNKKRIAEIKKRLSQLSEDFVQSWAGAQIADIDARKREFSDLHNELRGLLGKEPRVYN